MFSLHSQTPDDLSQMLLTEPAKLQEQAKKREKREKFNSYCISCLLT
jgi:hypothetical protein